jgi:hypothetical protein
MGYGPNAGSGVAHGQPFLHGGRLILDRGIG